MPHFLAPFYPVTSALSRRLGLDEALPAPEMLAPAVTRDVPSVFMDPEDVPAITGFSPMSDRDQQMAHVAGGARVFGPTLRYRVEGALATPAGIFTLRSSHVQGGPRPRMTRTGPVSRHAAGSYGLSHLSQTYFGHWAQDGLTTTLLAEADEVAYLPPPDTWPHAQDYSRRMGLPTDMKGPVRFDRLSFYNDLGLNDDFKARTQAAHRRMRNGLRASGLPGVMIRRGGSGVARVLRNEDALATALAARGFGICSVSDPLDHILAMTAEVPVVVTMEGSHWFHGFLAARRDAVIVLVNPADRFNAALSDYVSLVGQRLATIVAQREGEGYVVDVPRLIRLMERAMAETGLPLPPPVG